jgi:hypothetical protein
MAAHAATGGQWPRQRTQPGGFYAGLLDGSLLESELLDELTREHSLGQDRTLLTQTRFGLGCMLDQPQVANATFGLGARAFPGQVARSALPTRNTTWPSAS